MRISKHFRLKKLMDIALSISGKLNDSWMFAVLGVSGKLKLKSVARVACMHACGLLYRAHPMYNFEAQALARYFRY
jgi:hypothetical protein